MALVRQFDANGNPIGVRSVDEQGAAQAAPEPSTADSQEENAGGLLGAAREGYRALAGGLRDAAQESLETIDYLGDSITEAVGAPVIDEGGLQWLSADEIRERGLSDPFWGDPDGMGYELPEVAASQSRAGNMARGVTQFLAGMVGAGRLLKGAGQGARFLRGTGLMATAGRGAASGAVADFTVFDAHEERFSNFLRDNVGLRDPITEYLAADEDDTEAEGRLKNVLEGLGLGVAAEGLFAFTRLFRGAKEVAESEGSEAAAVHMNDGIRELAEENPELLGQLELFSEGSAPRHASSQSFRRVADEAAEEAAGEVSLYNRAGLLEPQARPASPVNTDAFREMFAGNALSKMADAGDGSVQFTELAGSRLFNHDYMDGAPSIAETLNIAADAIDPSALPTATTFKRIARAAGRELADATRTSPQALEEAIARQAADSGRQTQLMVAGKALAEDLAREVHDLGLRIMDAVARGQDTTSLEARYVRYIERMGELEANVKSIVTGAAQTTAAGRVHTRDVVRGLDFTSGDVIEQLRANVDRVGGSKMVQRHIRKMVATRHGPGGLRSAFDVARRSRWGRFMDLHNEYWINSILSGPKTHLVNILSNTVHTLLLPAERMIGGVLTGNVASIRQGARLYSGLASAIRDSFAAAGNAFLREQNILDPQGRIMEGAAGQAFHAISGVGLRMQQGPLASLANMLGVVLRMPSRALLTADEFFKQLNFRAMVRSQLLDKAAELVEAGTLKRSDVPRWVGARLDDAVERGAMSSSDGLEYAREVTFTKELERGTFGKSVQDTVNRHPMLRTILPFVRTPTNIMRAVVQRTPILHRLEQQLMADLRSGDPIRIAAARGKQATGMALWSGAAVLAAEGRITGGGPQDGRLRERLLDTGWRPYSFVLGSQEDGFRYIEFRRMDPFASFFGMAADLAEISGHTSDKDLGDIGAMMITALSNNLVSKTYLTGIVDAINAFTHSDRYAERWIQRQVTSRLPFSAAQRQIRTMEDGAMREAWGMIDAIKNTIPGISSELPARRSWITGEPILYTPGWGADMVSPVGEALMAANPIASGEHKGNAVLDELARLQYGFTAPLKTIANRTVELTSEQYSRLLELHGTIRLGRYTLSERLGRLFASRQYREGADRFLSPDEARVELVREVIRAYRDASTDRLIRETPELQEAVQGARQQNGLRLRGQLAPLNPLINQ